MVVIYALLAPERERPRNFLGQP